MPIQHTALAAARKPSFSAVTQDCLDCPDCNGACWSVIELALLPERVLQSNRMTSA